MKCPQDRSGCHLFGCRYNLLHEMAAKVAQAQKPHKRRQYERELMNEFKRIDGTCAMEFASEKEHTLEEVAQILGVTRERIRQIESRAVRKLRFRSVMGSKYVHFAEHVSPAAFRSLLETQIEYAEAKLRTMNNESGKERLREEIITLNTTKNTAKRKGLI